MIPLGVEGSGLGGPCTLIPSNHPCRFTPEACGEKGWCICVTLSSYSTARTSLSVCCLPHSQRAMSLQYFATWPLRSELQPTSGNDLYCRTWLVFSTYFPNGYLFLDTIGLVNFVECICIFKNELLVMCDNEFVILLLSLGLIT